MSAIIRMSVEGEVVIPREVRERLHLEPGAEFEVIEGPGRLVLQQRTPPRERLSHAEFVARLPKYDGPPMTLEAIERAIEAGRMERVRKIMDT